MEITGPFAPLAGALVRLMVQAASAVLVVVLGWKFLKIMFTGGSERAITGLVINLVVIGVCVAALSNLGMAAGVVTQIGTAIWAALGQVFNEAF